MFQFRRFPTYGYLIHRTLPCGGFPHSEISGSKLICSSPKLIAAYHVLHRLLMPRHSPCALSCLTCPGGASAPSFRSNFQSWSNFLVLLKFELCRLFVDRSFVSFASAVPLSRSVQSSLTPLCLLSVSNPLALGFETGLEDFTFPTKL